MLPEASQREAMGAASGDPRVSAAQRRLNLLARYIEKPAFTLIADQRALRRVVALYSAIFFRCHPDMRFTATRLENRPGGATRFGNPGGATRFGNDVPSISGLWCDQGEAAHQAVVLYFHGGAYTIGGPASHRHLTAALAGACGTRALLVDYRLAPEHPFPAAVEDAETAYRALLEEGWSGDQIILAGDSAGGGLAFALLHQIGAYDLPRPLCMIGFSPWADLHLLRPVFHRERGQRGHASQGLDPPCSASLFA